MKKIVSLTVCLLLVFGLVSVFAGGGRDHGGRHEFALGSSYARAAPPVTASFRFAEQVREATNGQIVINVFPDGAIGSERELFAQIAADEVEFGMLGMMGIDMFAPEFAFMSAPFLYKDLAHVRAIFNSPLGDRMKARFLESHVHLTAEVYRGIRNTSSNRAFRTPDEVRGLRIRMTEMPSWIAVWRDGLGATTIPVVLAELYTALQTGVAEASEGPYEQLATFKFYEVQRYLINTNHVMEWCALHTSSRMLNRLSADLRGIVLERARLDLTEWGSQLCLDMAEEFRQELLQGGMTEINVNVADYTNRLLPVYERFFNDGTWTSNMREVQSFAR